MQNLRCIDITNCIGIVNKKGDLLNFKLYIITILFHFILIKSKKHKEIPCVFGINFVLLNQNCDGHDLRESSFCYSLLLHIHQYWFLLCHLNNVLISKAIQIYLSYLYILMPKQSADSIQISAHFNLHLCKEMPSSMWAYSHIANALTPDFKDMLNCWVG